MDQRFCVGISLDLALIGTPYGAIWGFSIYPVRCVLTWSAGMQGKQQNISAKYRFTIRLMVKGIARKRLIE
jgi:hypothetical protein